MENGKTTHSLATLSKSFLYLSLTTVFGVSSWLAYTSPELNYRLSQQLKAEEEAHNQNETEKRKEWKFFKYTDVDIESGKYPLVVLKTGYKVIKYKEDKALIGWSYEVINTSPSTTYTATIDMDLEDGDGFSVGSSTALEYVRPKAHGVIKGTVLVDRNDVDRLSRLDWTVRLSPDWKDSESKTPKTRYQRLTDVFSSDSFYAPRWIRDHLKETSKEAAFYEGPKWTAIRTALLPETLPEQKAEIN